MKREKIAIIDSIGAHGSSFHHYLFGQSLGLIENEFSVHLYTNDKTKDPSIDYLKLYQFYKKLYNSKNIIIAGLRYLIGSLLSIFHARLSKIKIIHYHIFYTNILVFFDVFFAKILFSKVVITVHDVKSFTDKKSSNYFLRIIYFLSDSIITHNDFSKQEIKKISRIKCQDINIVPHGNYIPFIEIENNQLNSQIKLKIPKKRKVILFFGLIKKEKGLELLIKSIIDVKKKHPDILVLIAGKMFKNSFHDYKKLIDDNDLNDNFIIHNYFIKDEDVKYYYDATDIVVLPYKKIYQSGVLLMSLSFKKPVLVSSLPPFTEIITDDKNGFIFESECIESLSQKISFIFSDLQNLSKIGSNGFELAKETYNWTEIGSLLSKIYKSI